MKNNIILQDISKRIKGSRIWSKNGKERLYIPYVIENFNIHISCYFEIINDNLELIVDFKPANKRITQNICDILSIKAKKDIFKQYNEIINQSELKRRLIALDYRLKDDTEPYSINSMPHQIDALKFLSKMKVGALFADVGVGKTKIAIDLVISRYLQKKIRKSMVICPVRLVNNFRKEVSKFCNFPEINWEYYGLDSISMSDNIYLKTLSRIDNDTMLIIDESQYAKNHKAIRSIRIKEIADKCTYKLIMSGTPYSEDVSDIFMQYSLLSDNILKCKNWDRFAAQFLVCSEEQYSEVVGYKNLEYLTSLIEPYTYYIESQDCLHLPDTTDNLLTCELNSNQKYYYDKIKNELLDKLDNIDNIMERKNIIFAYLTMLQEIVCGFINYNNEFTYLGTNKYELLDSIDLSNQTLFFCKYLYEIEMIVSYLGKTNCAIYTGKNINDREKEKDKFTTGEKKYFVSTISTGGTGINGLEVSNNLVFFSSSFSFSERKQAIGRIKRKGQASKQLRVNYLITDTGIDKKINLNLNRKQGMVKEINLLLNDKTKLKKYIVKEF